MIPTELIAQGISIVAMVLNCLSYQQKKQKTVLTYQLFGSVLFAASYFLLGAYAGALLNTVGITRALVFINKEKINARHPVWLVGYSALYVSSYALIFTVFGKEPIARNLLVELLPVIAMILSTISFRAPDAATVRRFGLICSPLWLTYNICCFSVGAILCETISLVSIVVGILRFDRKKST